MGKHQADHQPDFWRGLSFYSGKSVGAAASVSLESLQFGLIELRIPEDQIRYYVKKSYHRLVAYENGVIDFIKAIF